MLAVIGIVWGVLYYGGIIPVYNSIVNQYGSGIFDNNVITFVLWFCAAWVIILLLAGLIWLWNQSNKRDLESY